MNIRRLVGFSAFLWFGLSAVLRAQDEEAGGHHAFTYLLREQHTVLHSNGEKVVRIRQRIRVLKPAAVEYLGEVRIPYNSYRVKAKFLHGMTILPDGRELEVDRKAIRNGQSAGMTDYLMYEDVAELSFSMPAVKVGAILDYEYELRDHRPTLKGECSDSFRLESSVPVEEARYTLVAPRKMTLKILPRHTDVEPKEERGFLSVTREWVFRDIPAFRYEPGMPSPYDSQIAIHVSTLSSWHAIREWYAALAEDAFALDDEVRAKVDELTGKATTEQEKIRALYLFMQRDIRYVGIELGRSAYQPHPATDCFRNRYGDCKDQSVLLVAMLRYLGIEAHLALARAGGGEVDRELPDVGQFNHVIVYVPRPDGPLWLDSTVKYMDETSHPQALDGNSALIVGGPEGTDFETLAAPPPERACERTIYEVDVMSGGLSRVKEVTEYVGRTGAEARVNYENLVAERRRKGAEDYVRGKGGVLMSFGNSDPHDLSQPFREWVVYETPSLLSATADGYALHLSAEELGWTVALPAVTRRPDEDRPVRRRPWVGQFSFGNGLACVLRLPPGMRPNPLPQPYERQLAQGRIRLSASVSGNAISAEAMVERVPCRIEAADYEAHKVRTDRAIGRASITITLTDEVRSLMNANQTRQARELATSLVAANPKSAEVHLALARVCHEVGRLVEARREYREALGLAPDRLPTYQALAMTYGSCRGDFGEGYNRDDVLQVARQAVERARDRRGAQLFLAQCLSRDEDGVFRGALLDNYDEAIAVYEQMLAERPDDLAPLAEIAECHYAMGDFAKAEACFNRVLRKQPDNLGAKAGQWVCAACLGRTDEAISAIRTAYEDKEERANELGRVSGLLMEHRMYGAILELLDSRLAIVQQRDQASETYRELLAAVAEGELTDHDTFFDLSTPEAAIITFFSAFVKQDRERLARSLSPRMGLQEEDIDGMFAAGERFGGVSEAEFRIDVFQRIWTRTRNSLPGGIVRVEASMPKRFRGQLGGQRDMRFAILCEPDSKGAWRICGFGKPDFPPGTLGQLALSFLDEGKVDVAKHYAGMVKQCFLRGRTLFSEASVQTELADLTYPDDTTFVKAMCASSLYRLPGEDDTAEPRRLRLARELAEAMPDAAPVRRLLANHLSAAEHYGQALVLRLALAKQFPKDKRLLVDLLTNLRRLYRYRDAMAAADQLGELMPNADVAKRIKLGVLISAGETQEGLELLKELAPRWKPDEVRDREIRLRAFGGERARVLVMADEVLNDENASPDELLSLVSTLRHAGCHRRALDCAETVYRRNPSAAVIAELCEQFLYTGDMEEARDAFDRLVATNDFAGPRAHFLACLGVALGRFEDAERIFADKLTRMDVDSKTYAELFIGVCRILRGDVAGGKEAIAKASNWQYDKIWPEPVLRFFAGEAKMVDLLAAARQAETPAQRDQFLCETYFYAAIKARMEGDETQYKLLLRQAADMRSYLTMECAMAHGLLGIQAPPDGE